MHDVALMKTRPALGMGPKGPCMYVCMYVPAGLVAWDIC